MQITLSPTRADARLTLHRAGDTLTFNGVAVDLATYNAESAPCDWIIGSPVETVGEWHITVLFPYGHGAPEAALFPELITLDGDGPVPLPPTGPVTDPDQEAG